MFYNRKISLITYTIIGFSIGITIQIFVSYIDAIQVFGKFSFNTLYFQQTKSNLHFSLNFITLMLSYIFYYLGSIKLENKFLKYEIKSVKENYKNNLNYDSKNDKIVNNQNSFTFDNIIILKSLIKVLKSESNTKDINNIIENNTYLYNSLIELEHLKTNRINNHITSSYNKFSLEDIVDYIDSKYSNLIKSNNLDFSIIKPKNNGYYVGHSDFINKVLECFISNSLYETKEGSISLIIEVSNDNIIFSIKNTGLGTLNTEYLEKYFEFYDSVGVLSISRWSLPIYYKAAKLYNYEIEINSILSKSSEYKLKVKIINNILNNELIEEINIKELDINTQKENSNNKNENKIFDINIDDNDLINMTIINNLIDINEDKSLLKELIDDFNKDKMLIDEAKQLFLLEKFSELIKIVEKIKGPSMNLGANKISYLCDKINKTISSTDKTELKYLLENLDTYFIKTCIELNKIIE